MPFILIRGTFHLVNRTPTGGLSGFEPDGDSIHFKPANPALLERLPRIGRPVRLTNIGSVMLRFEGIDALELHYSPDEGGRSSHQPRPLADAARDFLTGELALNPVPYVPPRNVRVKPPVERDATPGYILSRTLEVNGRPVSFAFADSPPAADGDEVHLSVSLMQRSLNFKLVRGGHAYPLFYDGLFRDLRRSLASAARQARIAKRGLWDRDRTKSGITVESQLDLETDGVIYPKLFRRLTDYLAETGAAVSGFPTWLAGKNERLLDLTTINFTGFDNVVEVKNNKVRLKLRPEEMVFISAK